MALVAAKSVPVVSEVERVTELTQSANVGRTYVPNAAGYTLDDLFRDRDRSRKRVLRI